MNTEQIVGIAAGIFTALSMLPQLVKILREKKAEDVSGWMLLVLLMGLSLWVVYGYLKQDWPIILTNGFSVLLNLVLAFFRQKYKEK
jgi:MtN3 and saliva related transmembrane protein